MGPDTNHKGILKKIKQMSIFNEVEKKKRKLLMEKKQFY